MASEPAAKRPRADSAAPAVVLPSKETERFARHISLKGFGVHAQDRLSRGSVLVVGAGGLGCPCAMYFAGSGVGTLGLVDKDVVSVSNLHRQIAHTESAVGEHKVKSLARSCLALNSGLRIREHMDGLKPENAVEICQQYDVVVDCSDNAPTRYLVNDACVMAGKPLVSGAAVGFDGQLTVYNHGTGPCYRCVFPVCPESQHCSRCEDAGVLGPVPGVIGTLQALEAIKLLSSVGQPLSGHLLIYDALTAQFQRFKLRARKPDCVACAVDSELARLGGPAGYPYKEFTHGQGLEESAATVHILPPERRISVHDLKELLTGPHKDALLLDVRPKQLFEAAHLPRAVHIAMDTVLQAPEKVKEMMTTSDFERVVVMCRRGNDSQVATQKLLDFGIQDVQDVRGGLHAWAFEVDTDMPVL